MNIVTGWDLQVADIMRRQAASDELRAECLKNLADRVERNGAQDCSMCNASGGYQFEWSGVSTLVPLIDRMCLRCMGTGIESVPKKEDKK